MPHRVISLAVATLGVLAVLALPSAAQEIPQLADEITDEAGLLTGREDEVRSALAETRDEVQLFVLTTDTTGPSTVTDLADEVAAANSLGGNDALLLIAIEDRSYALWVADDLDGISDAELAAISRDVVEPRLADGDYAEAAIDAAHALVDASGGRDAPVDEDTTLPEEPGARTSAGGPSPIWLLLLLPVVAFGALALVAVVRERRSRKHTAEERDRRLRELARRTNSRLIASDEAVREATTELGFAEAQFHPDDVAPFAAALASARDELHAAFEIRQRLDDDVPETVEQRRAMLEQIGEHVTRIDELLTAEHVRLDQLRDLERRAPELLDALRAEIRAATARRDAAEPEHARVVDASPTARESIGGNLEEADKHLSGARAAVERGLRAVDDEQRSVATRALREAQLSLAAAGHLVAAVEHAAAELDRAERGVDAAMTSAEAVLDDARTALSNAPQAARPTSRAEQPPAPSPDSARETSELPPPPATASPGALFADGHRRLAEARALRSQDVVRAYELATSADAAANEVLALVQEAHDRRQRAVGAAQSALKAATYAHERAEAYIETRRRGIGRDARTRLQEAERHLARARGSSDERPTEATQQARTAERLAEEAYRLAKQDFRAYDEMRGPFGRGPYGGHGGGTIVIGGFPIQLGGSRRGGGGLGGSVWGSSRKPGHSRGTSLGGMFGGGGRSMGGGFGGGRSRGGRF